MIYPMFAMVLLIFTIGILNLVWRIRSVKSKQVRARYYKVFDSAGADIPQHIIAGGKNYSNQFEVPMLFLVVSSLVLVLNQTGITFVILAWVFVISRVVHALIHLTYNHILHRMLAFQVGVFSMLGMWVLLFIALN